MQNAWRTITRVLMNNDLVLKLQLSTRSVIQPQDAIVKRLQTADKTEKGLLPLMSPDGKATTNLDTEEHYKSHTVM